MPPSRPAAAEEPLRVVYELAVRAGEDPEARARAVAVEQTVELGEEGADSALLARAVGRVESVEPVDSGAPGRQCGDRRVRAAIAYPAAALEPTLAGITSLLFGNVSLQAGVRVAAVEWPASLLAILGGPRFGVDGLRRLIGAGRRPLTATALKPLGASPAELADRARRFALGGIDLVKDDHGLADQALAPFGERVRRCQEAVLEANAETGGASLYLPNLTGPPASLPGRLDLLRSLGVKAVLVAPLPLGLDVTRELASSSGLALLAHPALSGAFFAPGHGIAPAVLLGDLFRAAGADGVIYPHPGGRFSFSDPDANDLCRALRDPLGGLLPSFPVAAGGIEVEGVGSVLDRLGPDTILLVGGSLYRRGDLEAAARRLVARVEEWSR